MNNHRAFLWRHVLLSPYFYGLAGLVFMFGLCLWPPHHSSELPDPSSKVDSNAPSPTADTPDTSSEDSDPEEVGWLEDNYSEDEDSIVQNDPPFRLWLRGGSGSIHPKKDQPRPVNRPFHPQIPHPRGGPNQHQRGMYTQSTPGRTPLGEGSSSHAMGNNEREENNNPLPDTKRSRRRKRTQARSEPTPAQADEHEPRAQGHKNPHV